VILIYYVLLGMGAGFLSGLLGVGGGVIIVPALLWLFQHQNLPVSRLISLAAGTSCVIMIITTSRSLFARRQHFHSVVSVYKKLVVSVILGALAGALLSHAIHPVILRIIFSVIMILVALGLLLPSAFNVMSVYRFQNYPLAGGIVGFVASMLGIGGSSLTVPFLISNGVGLRKSTLVAVALSLSLAPVAAAVYIMVGWSQVTIPWCTGYVYWPAVAGVGLGAVISAPIGVKYAQSISSSLLQKYFAVLLVIVAVHLFVTHG
jgi:uncharacterized protein